VHAHVIHDIQHPFHVCNVLLLTCPGSANKAKSILSKFFAENFGFSLSIYHVGKLTGLQNQEAKELRSFLSDTRVNK
jgi:hypothetical protein